MILLAGKQPGRDIEIVFTGLRAGEKLFEELFHPLENYQATAHSKIFLAQPRSMAWSLLTAQFQQAESAVRDYDELQLRRILEQLLPEFAARNSEASATVIPFVARPS
jgi:FlaA1/EpsC-like NDP-sugar epimerase